MLNIPQDTSSMGIEIRTPFSPVDLAIVNNHSDDGIQRGLCCAINYFNIEVKNRFTTAS